MNKKSAVLIYFFGSIILSIPLLISFMINNLYLNYIKSYITFRFNILAISILVTSYFIIIFYDLFFFKNINRVKKNINLIELMFGEKRSLKFNLTISLLSGYFEELLFRVYFYIFLTFLFKSFFNLNLIHEVIIIAVISIFFGILHIVQGIEAFIISVLISIIFFISLKLSGTIWYAVITHVIINFSEFQYIIPYQKKRLKE